ARAEMHLRRALELGRANPHQTIDQTYEVLWVLQFVRQDTDAPDKFSDWDEREEIGCQIIERAHPDLAALLREARRLTQAPEMDVTQAERQIMRAVDLANAQFERQDQLWLILGDQLESRAYDLGYRGDRPDLSCELLRSALASDLRVVAETN